MFEGIYEWLKDLAYYVILVTALFHMIPGEVWGKYIRFFTGLVMVVLLLSPVLQLFQEQDPLQIMEHYEQGMKDLESWKAGWMEREGLADQNLEPEEGTMDGQRQISIREISEDSEDIIEVEEIKIGEEGTEALE